MSNMTSCTRKFGVVILTAETANLFPQFSQSQEQSAVLRNGYPVRSQSLRTLYDIASSHHHYRFIQLRPSSRLFYPPNTHYTICLDMIHFMEIGGYRQDRTLVQRAAAEAWTSKDFIAALKGQIGDIRKVTTVDFNRWPAVMPSNTPPNTPPKPFCPARSHLLFWLLGIAEPQNLTLFAHQSSRIAAVLLLLHDVERRHCSMRWGTHAAWSSGARAPQCFLWYVAEGARHGDPAAQAHGCKTRGPAVSVHFSAAFANHFLGPPVQDALGQSDPAPQRGAPVEYA
ncbi:hypothetical protein B0H12DRAFT_1070308 [Mycena haematopus]|nr:hypothetical protein B0H12DRAFT_1070308 [Mycena haematopus]